MTVGYLLDLFIINEVRKEKLKDSLEADVKNENCDLSPHDAS